MSAGRRPAEWTRGVPGMWRPSGVRSPSGTRGRTLAPGLAARSGGSHVRAGGAAAAQPPGLGRKMMNYLRTAILLAGLTALFMAVGYLIGGQGGMMVALLIAAGMNLFSYWNADKLVLSMSGAHEIDERTAPDLHAIVRDLARNAGLPMPRVYLMDNPQPNAFATARNPDHAAVAVTTGLLEMLSREEVAGVLAHELAHVKNRDTLTMTITATIAGAISMLAQMAISRTREYSADRLGAEISGHPEWLASALAKIDRAAHAIPNETAELNPATAHLFIINPLSGARMDNLFATQPATENRIAALMGLARTMGRTSYASGTAAARGAAPRGPWGGSRASGPWG